MLRLRYFVGLFLAARLILLIALPLEGLIGYGDLQHFYRLAGLGWPYLDYWVEFPPLFPFLSAFVYQLVGGREHAYYYAIVLIFSLFQAASLVVFGRINRHFSGLTSQAHRIWYYLVLLAVLAYGWWYFDPLAVFFMLWGVLMLIEGRSKAGGVVLSLGILTKWFPALALVIAWRYSSRRKAIQASLLAVGITAIVYIALYFLSPKFTLASIRSQTSKGSWETGWALLDGNLNTGNFGPLGERFDPLTALVLRGNPALVPPWITLILFALLGLWLFWKAGKSRIGASMAFLCLTWCVFLLWSPGWSPQWLLYLFPLIILALPLREARLLGFTFILVNLLEWPVLLSRGYTWGLWITIPIRILLLVMIAYESWKTIHQDEKAVEALWKPAETL